MPTNTPGTSKRFHAIRGILSFFQKKCGCQRLDPSTAARGSFIRREDYEEVVAV
jgi:hypothetical protein